MKADTKFLEPNLYQWKEFSILRILIEVFSLKAHIKILRIENSFDWYRFVPKLFNEFS